MKTGRSLEDLAREITRQHNSKQDYLAPTTKVGLVAGPVGHGVALDLGGGRVYNPTDLAHAQIAEHAKVPKVYYDRMLAEAPGLLADNIRVWFDKYPATRLVRTLDGANRAFLSDSYRPLDNYQLAEAVLPTLLDNRLEIMSAEVTEKRLYIKAIDQRIQRDVPTGRKIGDGTHVFFDTCSPAVVISNSEVGYGRLTVDAGVYTKVCTNMATLSKHGMKRTHLGGKQSMLDSGVENIDRLLSSEAKAAGDRAIFLQVRDVVAAMFDEAVFAARCGELSVMAEDRIEKDVVKVIELSAKKFGLSELVSGAVQRHLIEGADLTRCGLFNAITRAAQDVESYDAASDLERLGGRIVDLSKNEWRELALA